MLKITRANTQQIIYCAIFHSFHLQMDVWCGQKNQKDNQSIGVENRKQTQNEINTTNIYHTYASSVANEQYPIVKMLKVKIT